MQHNYRTRYRKCAGISASGYIYRKADMDKSASKWSVKVSTSDFKTNSKRDQHNFLHQKFGCACKQKYVICEAWGIHLPKKTEIHRVRVTLGGDVINYPGITSTDTDSVTTTAIILNSVISNVRLGASICQKDRNASCESHFRRRRN